MSRDTDHRAQPPEVLWEDGLLLRPHHLQALQAYTRGLVSGFATSRPFSWGARRFSFREDLIGNWTLELEECDVVFPDGTPLVLGQTAVVPALDFRQAKIEDPTVSVWLGIPFADADGPNVEDAPDGTAGASRRYVIRRADLRDENSGSNPQSVGSKLLNARLLLGAEPPAGYQCLKVGVLRKVLVEGEEGRRYRLSPSFVPASLSLEASPALHRILTDILHQVEEKNEQLLEDLAGRRSLLTGEAPERPGTLLKLQATNAVLPVLRQLVAVPELHPFDVFLHFCRLVGELALYSESWRPPDLKAYDHEDPLASFEDVKRVVVELLSAAVNTAIQRVPFQLEDARARVYQAAIPERFLAEGVALVLGVQTSRPPEEVAAWFAQGRTVLAAPAAIANILRARIEGLPCAPDPALNSDLRDRKGYAFLSIRTASELWGEVRGARRLALAGEAARSDDARFYLYAVGVQGEEE